MVAVGGIRMRGKRFLPIILMFTALLFCFPVCAQEQRVDCLVTATVEETGEKEGDGEPSPSPPVTASPQTVKEGDAALTGLSEQDGGLWVFLGVDLRRMCGWPMLFLFLLLLLLYLCLAIWQTWRKTGRERREDMREK